MEVIDRPPMKAPNDTPDDINEKRFRWMWFYTAKAGMMTPNRESGLCCRCIKDPPLSKEDCIRRHTPGDIGFPMPVDVQ